MDTGVIKCKLCRQISSIVRYGKRGERQIYYCTLCKVKFVGDDTAVRMRTPIVQIGTALRLFYHGLSFSDIVRDIHRIYYSSHSKSTVYEWIMRFTAVLLSLAEDQCVSVGHTWFIKQAVLNSKHGNTWLLNIFDGKSSFILASHVSSSISAADVKILLCNALTHAAGIPDFIITNKSSVYVDAIEDVFGGGVKHLSYLGPDIEPYTDIINQFYLKLKERTRYMQNIDSMRLVAGGWQCHYNFFRPNEVLSGKTPAVVAGLHFPFTDWLGLVSASGECTSEHTSKVIKPRYCCDQQ